MTHAARAGLQFLVMAVLVTGFSRGTQERGTPPVPNPTLPNPYRLAPGWPTLPASMKGPNGRKWGEVIRVHVAPGGNVWVFHRCFNDQPNGDATCLNRGEANPPILEFSAAGTLLRSFGVGLFAHPHGFTVDQEETSGRRTPTTRRSSSVCRRRMRAAARWGRRSSSCAPGRQPEKLLTIGTPGVGGIGPYLFDRPTGVAVAAERRHLRIGRPFRNRSNTARIVKYSRDGTFLKTWGRNGEEPGNFRDPHDLYVGGSKGLCLRRRLPEQSRSGLRPGRRLRCRLAAVRSAQFRVRRQERQHLRREPRTWTLRSPDR